VVYTVKEVRKKSMPMIFHIAPLCHGVIVSVQLTKER
jgi:hypothetical protein